MGTKTYTQKDLEDFLSDTRAKATVKLRFVEPYAGGQPAQDKDLRAFVENHLGISPATPDFEVAVKRIKEEEIGERDLTPDAGELNEKKVYSVNVIRHNDHGHYIQEHQIKAMLKQAASRLGLFVKKRGSKGDVAEMGSVHAVEDSLQNADKPWQVFLRNDTGATQTHFEEVKGSVTGPKGRKSICTHTEVAPEGSTLHFSFSWAAAKLTANDMMKVFAAGTVIGLGSCPSKGYGKFVVDSLEITSPDKQKA